MAQGAFAERQDDLDDALAAYVQAHARAEMPEVDLLTAGIHLKTGEVDLATPLFRHALDSGLDTQALAVLARAISWSNLRCEARPTLDWALSMGLSQRGPGWATLLGEPVADLGGCSGGDTP
jgi:hypothetical protein